MNEHSLWRIALAHQITPQFTANPRIQACFIFGSVVLGISDRYSDLELGFIWPELPSSDELRVAAQNLGAEKWKIEPYGESQQAWLEQFYIQGMKIEAAHWQKVQIDRTIVDVIEHYDVSQIDRLFEKQTIASHLQRAIILYGEDLVKQWQAQLSPYPEGLAVAMVQKHLKFRPFDGQMILTERMEIPMLYENNCSYARWLINILFGLNRIYHPGFKWTRYFVSEMAIKPHNFFERLEQVFQSPAIAGTQILRLLIEETFMLIEQHLPQVDLTEQRQIFDRTCSRWQSKP